MPWHESIQQLDQRHSEALKALNAEIASVKGMVWDLMLWRAKFTGMMIAANFVGGILTAIFLSWITHKVG